MAREICTVPAQVLTDAGVTKCARLCLAVMYLYIESDGFCPLSATEIAGLIGTTDNAVRRYWSGLREAGYIAEDSRPALLRRRRAIKGHSVALSLDGTLFEWAKNTQVGSQFINEGAAE